MNQINETHILHGIQKAVKDMLKDIHTCMPGKIEAVSGTTADVLPLLKNPFTGQAYPVISGVPVLMNEDTCFSVTLAVGDLVLLVFSERSLENWTANGNVADTTIERHFDLSDPFAIPLLLTNGAMALKALLTEDFISQSLNHTHVCAGSGSPSGTGTWTPTPTGVTTQKVKAV